MNWQWKSHLQAHFKTCVNRSYVAVDQKWSSDLCIEEVHIVGHTHLSVCILWFPWWISQVHSNAMSDVYRCSPEVDGWKKHVGSWSNCTRRMLSGHLLCGDGTYVEPNKDCTANPNMTTKELGLHYGQWTYRHTISYSLDSDPCPVARLRICSLCVKHFDSLVKNICNAVSLVAWLGRRIGWGLDIWRFGSHDLHEIKSPKSTLLGKYEPSGVSLTTTTQSVLNLVVSQVLVTCSTWLVFPTNEPWGCSILIFFFRVHPTLGCSRALAQCALSSFRGDLQHSWTHKIQRR